MRQSYTDGVRSFVMTPRNHYTQQHFKEIIFLILRFDCVTALTIIITCDYKHTYVKYVA